MFAAVILGGSLIGYLLVRVGLIEGAPRRFPENFREPYDIFAYLGIMLAGPLLLLYVPQALARRSVVLVGLILLIVYFYTDPLGKGSAYGDIEMLGHSAALIAHASVAGMLTAGVYLALYFTEMLAKVPLAVQSIALVTAMICGAMLSHRLLLFPA